MKVLFIDDSIDDSNLFLLFANDVGIKAIAVEKILDAIQNEPLESYDYIFIDRMGVANNHKALVDVINKIVNNTDKIKLMSSVQPPDIKLYDNEFVNKDNMREYLSKLK